MKLRGFAFVIIAVVFSFAPQFLNTSSAAGGYSAQLITPRAGQVVSPGQRVRVAWTAVLPPINTKPCEMEVWLSLDGGRTFTMWISPWMNADARSFDWIVPNTPTNAAVMDIRFGCEAMYPESFAPQPASTFVISKAAPAS